MQSAGMHSPSRLKASLRNSREKSPCISYGAKSLPPTVFGKLHEPLYTYCVGATLQLPILNVVAKT